MPALRPTTPEQTQQDNDTACQKTAAKKPAEKKSDKKSAERKLNDKKYASELQHVASAPQKTNPPLDRFDEFRTMNVKVSNCPPDEAFFNLLINAQSSRMEDQRATVIYLHFTYIHQ